MRAVAAVPAERKVRLVEQAAPRIEGDTEVLRRILGVGICVATVRRPCPHASCRACPAGRQDFCFTGDFTERGIKGRHGFTISSPSAR